MDTTPKAGELHSYPEAARLLIVAELMAPLLWHWSGAVYGRERYWSDVPEADRKILVDFAAATLAKLKPASLTPARFSDGAILTLAVTNARTEFTGVDR